MFIGAPSRGWLGGMNYYQNLISAIYSLDNRKIEIVVFTNTTTDPESIIENKKVRVIPTRLLDKKPAFAFLRRVSRRVLGKDIILERLLKKYNVSVLSHSGYFGRKSRLPAIGWIPDFQYIHITDNFTKQDILTRKRENNKICSLCTRVIVSSHSALKDLEKEYTQYASKAVVLQFVASRIHVDKSVTRKDMEKRYSFTSPFFYLPNQLWAHKNHRVVVDALVELKKAGYNPLVLATGSEQDYRNPGHVKSLFFYVEENDVSDNIRFLGVIPYSDLALLMRYSIAVINPSLFEGWSTTVEEAKTIGKRIILSDIPVHREQNPGGGMFFDPHDPVGLAEIMKGAIDEPNLKQDEELMRLAAEQLLERKRGFGERYQAIVIDALG